MRFIPALILAAVALAADRLPPIVVQNAELAGGPAIVNVGPRSATVVWVTKTAGGLHANRFGYDKLEPGRDYEFEFRASPPVRARFRTAPQKRTDFTFLVYGDTRTRAEPHRKVAEAMARYRADFLLNTGDLVADGRRGEQWAEFFSIERDLLRSAALFPVIGNHERHSPMYTDFFDARLHYSVDWGKVHVAVLDSDVKADSPEWQEQKAWLKKDLGAAAGADFRFVVFHHPPYSAVAKRAPNRQSRELIPIFEKYRVAAVFSGHDHNYQRHASNGIKYIVTGGGGAPLYDVDGPLAGTTEKLVKTEHFLKVDIRGRRATVQAIDADGKEFDRFVLQL